MASRPCSKYLYGSGLLSSDRDITDVLLFRDWYHLHPNDLEAPCNVGSRTPDGRHPNRLVINFDIEWRMGEPKRPPWLQASKYGATVHFRNVEDRGF